MHRTIMGGTINREDAVGEGSTNREDAAGEDSTNREVAAEGEGEGVERVNFVSSGNFFARLERESETERKFLLVLFA